jgi:dTDP-4-dehydrorhamnose reductase
VKYLLTGGSGAFGSELRKIWDREGVHYLAPTHSEMDFTRLESIREYLINAFRKGIVINEIVHAGAKTGVAIGEKGDLKPSFWLTNVEGVHNLVEIAKKMILKMVFISTDYVFNGEKGDYRPSDTPDPINYYAMTKLIGEEIVKTMPETRYQIIRASFKPSKWQYPVAFTDQITSADYVDVIAPLVWDEIKKGRHGISHIGTEPKTTYELASRRNEVKSISIEDVKGVKLPKNISLHLGSEWDGKQSMSPLPIY